MFDYAKPQIRVAFKKIAQAIVDARDVGRKSLEILNEETLARVNALHERAHQSFIFRFAQMYHDYSQAMLFPDDPKTWNLINAEVERIDNERKEKAMTLLRKRQALEAICAI